MREIIEKKTNGKCICKLCPNSKEFNSKSTYRHILESETHHNLVTQSKQRDHDHLVNAIKVKKENNSKYRPHKQSNSTEGQDMIYLSFIAFCQQQNFSFKQIANTGNYLNNLGSSPFKSYTFSREEISLVARSFGVCLKEELKESLLKSPFTLMLDTSIIHRVNIAGIKVRFLQDDLDLEGVKRTSIQNRTIGLKYLGGDSSAKTMMKIIQEKVFSLDDNLKKNFVGFVHDHASALSSDLNGLLALLKETIPHHFFDLKDPCHSFSLALKKSLSELPQETMDFIQDIHTHFAWPQRTAILKQLQCKNSRPILGIKKYVSNRWLSLGESLQRLIEIWDDLLEYMNFQDESPKYEKNKAQYKEFAKLLENQTFRWKIRALYAIISRLNIYNKEFQTSTREIQDLKLKTRECVIFLVIFFFDMNMSPRKQRILLQKSGKVYKILQRSFFQSRIFLKTFTQT